MHHDPAFNPRRETPMTSEIRELMVEEEESFELEDLEMLLETATEELEPRVAPGTAYAFP